MQQRRFATVVVSAVCLVIGMSGCKQGESLDEGPVESSYEGPDLEARRVTDKVAGVSVDCPGDPWICSESEHTGDTMFHTTDGRGNLMLQKVAGAKTLAEAVEKIEIVGGELQGRKFTKRGQHPSGGTWLLSEGACTSLSGEGPLNKHWSLIAPMGERFVICEGYAETSDFDALKGDFEKICGSMQDAEGQK